MVKTVIATFVIAVVIVIFVLQKNTSSNIQSLVTSKISETKTSPSPMPFEELTIPYLRNRDYQSQLGELDQVSNNGGYTSYLTSYTSDGLKVNGLLTKPTREMPEGGWPAIIFVHGYIPPTLYQTQTRYIDHVNSLARNGFVVFKIDLRGHGNSEGDAGGGYYSSDYVIDTLNARAALQSSGFVNPDNIGLWGHSMSGNVVFRAYAAKPEIKAVTIWAGAVYTYTDFSQFEISDNSYRPPASDSPARIKRNQLFEAHGAFSEDSEFWKMVPATNYLDGLTGAVEIHHAVDDNVVEIGYSRNLMTILDSTDIYHKLWEYPSGGHNITGSSFSAAMQNTVEFFKKYLN